MCRVQRSAGKDIIISDFVIVSKRVLLEPGTTEPTFMFCVFQYVLICKSIFFIKFDKGIITYIFILFYLLLVFNLISLFSSWTVTDSLDCSIFFHKSLNFYLFSIISFFCYSDQIITNDLPSCSFFSLLSTICW